MFDTEWIGNVRTGHYASTFVTVYPTGSHDIHELYIRISQKGMCLQNGTSKSMVTNDRFFCTHKGKFVITEWYIKISKVKIKVMHE